MAEIDTGTNELLCDLEDGVATVTLNKPEKRNALGDILTPTLRSILLELEESRNLALELANGPRNALRLMKENVNRAVLGDLRSCLAGEAEGMVRSVRTADHKEAVRAFVEKREPRFER